MDNALSHEETSEVRPGINPEDLRVELRRYLAGIPFSHRRELSPSERRELWARTRPYLLYGGTFLVVSLFILVAFWKALGFGAWFGFATFFSMPAACLYWMWPFVQALRANQIDVYIGRMHQLTNFDVALDHYLKSEAVKSNVNRYVELHAVGNGDRIWKLEGVENDETLSAVRSIRVALVPDHDERGERPLTDEERAELLLRARDLARPAPILATALVTLIICLSIGGILIETALGFTGPVVLALWLLSTYLALKPYAQRWQFGRHALKDRRIGKVTDGVLPSGLPWVVNGEPARWRVGRPRGGTNGITRDQAVELETMARQAAAAPLGPSP